NSQVNARHGARNFARDKGFTADWTLMIEKNSIRSMHAISFAIIDCNPVSIKLCHPVWTAGIKGSSFALRSLLHLAVKLGRRSLIESRPTREIENADRFKQPQR